MLTCCLPSPASYFKKMMNDKNAVAMEKGLEPIYAFYDRYDHAAKYELSPIPPMNWHLDAHNPILPFWPISCQMKPAIEP